ncbi:unnamed protein product [marine sediment metagenome]|uniref:Uncharacterized protein n=1 Tax=marine sediment metagenome TaxID=412755 RepID=X1B095_9ZZZZ
MTDFELNKAIAEALGTDLSGITEGNQLFYNITEYCANWNDLMPLVDEHGIESSYDVGTDSYIATPFSKSSVGSSINDSHQRALAECLLKVLQENKSE